MTVLISIVSFNIRCAVKEDGENYLPLRINNIIGTIAQKEPDLIGFQELPEDESCMKLEAALTGYRSFGYGRGPHNDGETNKIFVRKDAFAVLAYDQFWLSPTPRVPGSRYEEQSRHPRICVWVKLLHRQSGLRLYYFNTHLDHVSPTARSLGLKRVFETIGEVKKEEDLPVLLSGDFNFNPSESTYEMIAGNGFTDLTKGIGGTFHGFHKIDDPKQIDYVLCDTPVKSAMYRWTKGIEDGVFLSDHDPVEVKIEF